MPTGSRAGLIGWVGAGIDHNTAEFAVETIRRWWRRMGSLTQPKPTKLMITADAGGKNSSPTCHNYFDTPHTGVSQMAKRPSTSHEDLQQYEPADLSSNESQLIQFDPDAPPSGPTGIAAAIKAQNTADTFLPDDTFFQARDELHKRLGGIRAFSQAVAQASPDSAGLENILGFGVGFRYAADSLCDDVTVKVYVREKLPLARVSKASQIPDDVNGVPTDVEAIGEVILQTFAKRYPRPVPCGVSISNVNLNGSGTLGCLVALNNRRLCMLSNNHVLANENAATIGDAIIQPGNAEPAPGPDQTIGVLEQFVPIQAAGNLVDAAVAWTSLKLVSPKHVTYAMNPLPVVPTLGMSVLKNGRTTQSTLGMVTDIGVNITVAYDPFPAGAEMRDQIAVRGVNGPFSKPGDSGSLIVTAASKQPVALLFAGSNDNSITFGNPIAAVISALGIERFVAP